MAENHAENREPNTLESLVDRTLRSVNDADAEAAAQRVADIRLQRRLRDDALVEHLIKQKALQTGTVGAATSAAALIPGFGSLASFTLGVVTDVGVTLRLQSELVLEIAAAREHTLSPAEEARLTKLIRDVGIPPE